MCLIYSVGPAPSVNLFCPLFLLPNELVSSWTGQAINDVKPFSYLSMDESCRSRIFAMCSTLCLRFSPKPKTFVALVVSPSDCASSITFSQLSGLPFFGETSVLTSSTSISAPPPGKPCNPAPFSFCNTSIVFIPETSAIPSISMGLKQSKSILGCASTRYFINSMYHENSKSGFTPPCIKILEPPICSSSLMRSEISWKDCVYVSSCPGGL